MEGILVQVLVQVLVDHIMEVQFFQEVHSLVGVLEAPPAQTQEFQGQGILGVVEELLASPPHL